MAIQGTPRGPICPAGSPPASQDTTLSSHLPCLDGRLGDTAVQGQCELPGHGLTSGGSEPFCHTAVPADWPRHPCPGPTHSPPGLNHIMRFNHIMGFNHGLLCPQSHIHALQILLYILHPPSELLALSGLSMSCLALPTQPAGSQTHTRLCLGFSPFSSRTWGP